MALKNRSLNAVQFSKQSTKHIGDFIHSHPATGQECRFGDKQHDCPAYGPSNGPSKTAKMAARGLDR